MLLQCLSPVVLTLLTFFSVAVLAGCSLVMVTKAVLAKIMNVGMFVLLVAVPC